MSIAFVPLTVDKTHNRRILSNGLTVTKCTYAGAARPIDYMETQGVLPGACRLGSVEEYADGAKNLFVRHLDASEAHAVIVIRK